MKKVLDFSKSQGKEKWYKQWWFYAVVVMYLLVVFKTTMFEKGEGWQLQRYDQKIIPIASEEGEVFGTIGLKREGSFLQATYNLYIATGLEKNEVCFACAIGRNFNRPCRSIDNYNYVGQVEGGGFSGKGLSGVIAPVFCEQFTKPESPVESTVSWSEAVCFSNKSGAGASTDKFYFNGVAIFESYEEIFGLNQFKIFDSQKFTIKDSCHEGVPNSNFEQTDIEKAIEFGEKIRNYKLVFEND